MPRTMQTEKGNARFLLYTAGTEAMRKAYERLLVEKAGMPGTEV